MAKYPSELSALSTTNANATASENTHPALHNEANAEVNAIEEALGTRLSNIAFNVKTFGAKGDGSTEDHTAIQNALNAAASAGGKVYFPQGTYIIGSTLTIDNNVAIVGAGKEATTLKLANSKNIAILKTARYGLGGSTGGSKGFSIRHIGFDGNKANNISLTTPTIDLDGLAFSIQHVKVQNGTKVNLRSIAFSREDPGSNMEAKVYDLLLLEAGEKNLVWEGPHDSVLQSVIAAKFASGAGLNIFASGISNWTDCHTYGNTEFGWEIETGTFVNCQSEGTKKGQVKIVGSTIEWIGGRVFSAGGEDGKIGFVFSTGSNGVRISEVVVENCDNGSFKFEGLCFNCKLSGNVFTSGAEAKPALTGTISSDLDVFDLFVKSPLTLLTGENEFSRTFGGLTFFGAGDIDSTAGRFSIGERASAPSQTANFTKIYSIDDGNGKTQFKARFGTGSDVTMAREGAIDAVASASTITVRDAGPVTMIELTGTTEVKKINATRPHHLLIIKWASTAKLINGENLKLKESVSSPTANDTITLVCDGTNWYQVSPIQVI